MFMMPMPPTASEIPAFVDDLTPVLLRADTRVTNHGFVDGTANQIPAVLQAGLEALGGRQVVGVRRIPGGLRFVESSLALRQDLAHRSDQVAVDQPHGQPETDHDQDEGEIWWAHPQPPHPR